MDFETFFFSLHFLTSEKLYRDARMMLKKYRLLHGQTGKFSNFKGQENRVGKASGSEHSTPYINKDPLEASSVGICHWPTIKL